MQTRLLMYARREREEAAEALRHARNQSALGAHASGGQGISGSRFASVLEGPIEVCAFGCGRGCALFVCMCVYFMQVPSRALVRSQECTCVRVCAVFYVRVQLCSRLDSGVHLGVCVLCVACLCACHCVLVSASRSALLRAWTCVCVCMRTPLAQATRAQGTAGLHMLCFLRLAMPRV